MFKHCVEKPFESTRNRYRLATMICTLALLGNVEAASLPDGVDDRLSQIIFPSPLSTATIPGAAVTLDVMYDTLPQDETLTGIGVRVHFDSSKLSFDLVDQTLAFGRLFNPALVVAEADTSDFDGDPSTDQYLSMAWVDFAGSWPGGVLPEKLAAVHFVAAGDFAGSTTIRFSASDLAAGYEFSSQPATVNNSIMHQLTVTTSGSGTVTSSPAGIVCGEDCMESYSEGTLVTLTATSTGDSFVGWSGDCSGTDTKATLTMTDAKSCNAEFATQQDLVFADGFE